MKINPSQIEVKYVHHNGSDLSVVNAARRSFNSGSEWEVDKDGRQVLSKRDEKLLEFLARGLTSSEYEELLEVLVASTDIEEIEKLIWNFRRTPEHDTPFNCCFATFDVKAPIFCRAQLV